MKHTPVFFLVSLALFGFVNTEGDATEEPAKLDPNDERAKNLRVLLIPGDVLRDFPGLCFASTLCTTVKPGDSWELGRFCGRSTCIVSEDTPPRLLELVEDCGPAPLPNPKCQLDTEKSNKTASYPLCCPIFKCEEGEKLEYPEIPTTTLTPVEGDTSQPKA